MNHHRMVRFRITVVVRDSRYLSLATHAHIHTGETKRRRFKPIKLLAFGLVIILGIL